MVPLTRLLHAHLPAAGTEESQGRQSMFEILRSQGTSVPQQREPAAGPSGDAWLDNKVSCRHNHTA